MLRLTELLFRKAEAFHRIGRDRLLLRRLDTDPAVVRRVSDARVSAARGGRAAGAGARARARARRRRAVPAAARARAAPRAAAAAHGGESLSLSLSEDGASRPRRASRSLGGRRYLFIY